MTVGPAGDEQAAREAVEQALSLAGLFDGGWSGSLPRALLEQWRRSRQRFGGGGAAATVCSALLSTAARTELRKAVPGITESTIDLAGASLAAVSAPRVFPSDAGPSWGLLPAAVPRVSSGCPVIDELLGGGAVCGEATEVAGVAGAGKTQLLMQWCFSACRPLHHGGGARSAVIVALEPLPMPRVAELASVAAQRADCWRAGDDPMALLEISTARRGAPRWEHLRAAVADLARLAERQRAAGRPVALVAVDSIAAAAAELDEDPAARAQGVLCAAAELKRVCALHGAALVVANHVVANFNAADTDLGCTLPDSVPSVRPALGMSWASAPNTRVVLLRGRGDGPVQRRLLRVETSPSLPRRQCQFEVTAAGVRGVAGTSEPVGADLLYDVR
eukprot:TRINITY_DN26768_c0_g1_i1.p1 TRINITY_DN26768_c0_g1~~TRINITY_DN26768_c0_g1_i1.p1  ORF type:complete len:406 (+),score=122.48 TRINITY_DN26768_c0_g1_i1:48-1220(+)